MGIWRNNPATPEGKYPIVLRRDGTPLEVPYIVLTLRDPCTCAALDSYATRLKALVETGEYVKFGWASREEAESFIHDIQELAAASYEIAHQSPGDPGAGPHRKDDPVTLAWARSLGCPAA